MYKCVCMRFVLSFNLMFSLCSSYPLLCRLEIFLKDKENLDVGEWLVEQGLCEQKDPTKKVKGPVVIV